MTVYLDKIREIINKFHGDDRERLVSHYMAVSKGILLDEKEVKRSKLDLLQDLHAMDGEDVDQLSQDVLGHKVLQTRALVLDLISNDYTGDNGTVYKPEEWIRQISRDIEETFDFDSDFGKTMFELYNKRLLEEFCDIFISENQRFGADGNQLLLNFHFYRRFVAARIELDFGSFFYRIRSCFRRDNAKSEEELEDILCEE